MASFFFIQKHKNRIVQILGVYCQNGCGVLAIIFQTLVKSCGLIVPVSCFDMYSLKCLLALYSHYCFMRLTGYVFVYVIQFPLILLVVLKFAGKDGLELAAGFYYQFRHCGRTIRKVHGFHVACNFQTVVRCSRMLDYNIYKI